MQIAKRSLLFKRTCRKKYKFDYLTVLISLLIKKGKKNKAKSIVFFFFLKLKKYFIKKIQLNRNYIPLNFDSYFIFFLTEVFERFRPRISLISKKVAAKIYTLPWYIDSNRSRILFLRWFILSALNRAEYDISEKLFNEFIDLCYLKGSTLKKLQEYYVIAINNRPFLKLLKRKRRVSRSRLKKFSI